MRRSQKDLQASKTSFRSSHLWWLLCRHVNYCNDEEGFVESRQRPYNSFNIESRGITNASLSRKSGLDLLWLHFAIIRLIFPLWMVSLSMRNGSIYHHQRFSYSRRTTVGASILCPCCLRKICGNLSNQILCVSRDRWKEFRVISNETTRNPSRSMRTWKLKNKLKRACIFLGKELVNHSGTHT